METTENKIRELLKCTHLMNKWESRPKGTDGPQDFGGFMEGVATALEKGWKLTEKRSQKVDDMYERYVIKKAKNPHDNRVIANKTEFLCSENIRGLPTPEGWRLEINGVIVGMPVSRESAFVIGDWIAKSESALIEVLTNRKDIVEDQQPSVKTEQQQEGFEDAF